MRRRPERRPLSGADAFLLAFDTQTRRRNGASHLSQIVLRLGPGFDAARFERTLADVARANPIVRAPIRRRFGVGTPEYRLDLAARAAHPVFAEREASAPPGPTKLPPLFEQRLNARHPRGRAGLFHADAVRYRDGRTDLALTWLHMLLDGFGSERFLELLADCGAGRRAPDDVPSADRPDAPPDLALPAAQRERGRMAMAWQHRMTALGHMGVRSPAGPERGLRQALEVDRVHYATAESDRITKRAVERAGFLTPMIFYLAASIRAHDAVARRRGPVPPSYVVPLPVNLRPKGAEGGIFGTRVSLLWFQVPSALVGDLDALLDELKAQRRRAIGEKMVENGAAAMGFARSAPSWLYGRMARRALRGELCSFFFAYTGEFCPGLDEFFGAPVEDGFGVPSVPASPGSLIVLALRDGRLGYTHMRQREAFDADELAVFRDALDRDLLG